MKDITITTAEDRDRRVNETATLAGRYFDSGFCCTEALLKAVTDIFSPDIPLETLRLTTGFCGGMVDRTGPCGVFSGGIMAIGLFTGRISPEEDDSLCKYLSILFVESLRETAGAMVCKDILERMKQYRQDPAEGCKNLTVKGAEIVAEILTENLSEE